jgi:undecaprenyl-phosphate 4-deoxy-4-formamido-L-arabinose transferase
MSHHTTYRLDISVIVPVFNSQHTLLELNHRLHKVLNELKVSFDIIYVDDCSKDESWKILNELKTNHPETVKIIKLSKNFGQHQATICGFTYAKGKYIITIDDDLEQEPEAIQALLDSHKKTQATVSYYIYQNKKNKIRNFLTTVFKFLARLDGKTNKGSSFRIINHALIRKIVQNNRQAFVYIDELILWYISPEKINFIEVQPPESLAKQQSRYSLLGLVKMALYLILYSTTLPLRAVTLVGFLTASVNLLFGVYFIFRKLFFNVPLGYTSIIVSVLFSSGIILMAIGVLGIYINRLFQAANHSPVFNVEEERC